MKLILVTFLFLVSSTSYSAENWYTINDFGECIKSKNLKEIYADCKAKNIGCMGIVRDTENGNPSVISVSGWVGESSDRDPSETMTIFLGAGRCKSALEKIKKSLSR